MVYSVSEQCFPNNKQLIALVKDLNILYFVCVDVTSFTGIFLYFSLFLLWDLVAFLFLKDNIYLWGDG